jgi:hypothetical protein
MAKLLKLRRGTTSQHGSFTGAEGEVTVDTDKETLVVHDGSTAGGHPVAAEDMANVSSASIAGRLANDSIATTKIAGGALPTDVTVASANIVDGTIVNADVNASAAIAGSKISPDFGSQHVGAGQVNITGATPRVRLIDSGDDPDYSLRNNNGTFEIYDENAPNARITVDNAKIVSKLNHDFDAGIDVTGNANVGSDLTVSGGDVTINGTVPALHFNDTDHESDYQIRNNNGTFQILDVDQGGGTVFFQRETNADCTFTGNVNVTNGVDVTGNITVSGTVDGRDVAQDGGRLDELYGGSNQLKSTVDIQNGATAATQSAGDNSTKIATTAFVGTAVSNLVDSSPAALNTLNELAAAIGDDANFSTTVTNSIAAKLPLTGGTMSGDIGFGDNNKIKMGASHDIQIYNDGSDSFIQNTTDNDLLIHQQGNAGIQIKPQNSYPVELYYNASKKAETVSGGFTVTGTCTATAFAGDGSALTGIVSFVSGMILLWSGSTGNIPSGWVLCNGSNSTPDLRDRFVIGAGNSYSVGATGGSTTDTVNITVSGTTSGPSASNPGGYPFQYSFGTNTHTHTFSGSGSDTVSTMSPYYALCYIMKT